MYYNSLVFHCQRHGADHFLTAVILFFIAPSDSKHVLLNTDFTLGKTKKSHHTKFDEYGDVAV